MDKKYNVAKCSSGECKRRGWQKRNVENFIYCKMVNLNLNKKWLPVKKEVAYKKILRCANKAVAVDPGRYLENLDKSFIMR